VAICRWQVFPNFACVPVSFLTTAIPAFGLTIPGFSCACVTFRDGCVTFRDSCHCQFATARARLRSTLAIALWGFLRLLEVGYDQDVAAQLDAAIHQQFFQRWCDHRIP
jgi:hypothetical protein